MNKNLYRLIKAICAGAGILILAQYVSTLAMIGVVLVAMSVQMDRFLK